MGQVGRPAGQSSGTKFRGQFLDLRRSEDKSLSGTVKGRYRGAYPPLHKKEDNFICSLTILRDKYPSVTNENNTIFLFYDLKLIWFSYRKFSILICVITNLTISSSSDYLKIGPWMKITIPLLCLLCTNPSQYVLFIFNSHKTIMSWLISFVFYFLLHIFLQPGLSTEESGGRGSSMRKECWKKTK